VTEVTARAPGRINLIGDHTDHTGGLCFPMAIDRGVEIRGATTPEADVVVLSSDAEAGDAVVPLDAGDPARIDPPWARYVAGVVAELRPTHGFAGTVRTTLPSGVGLSSSAALEVAVALALGADTDDPVRLARLCQAAEHAARGLPTGILDQISSICGVEGHGLLLDCHTVAVRAVALPPPGEAEWVALVPRGARALESSAYGERVRELAVAEAEIGPLRLADLGSVGRLADPVIRKRARHVVTENARVRAFADAIEAGDLVAAGGSMSASHASLSTDFESSTPAIDELVGRLARTPGVFGARITGGGWGGCAVALTRPGTLVGLAGAWIVRPSAGASRSQG
jgi:galactokinase